jgi:hypothetical protein
MAHLLEITSAFEFGRVARGGYPPPALTEPYLWFSHTALRAWDVCRHQRHSSRAVLLPKSYKRKLHLCNRFGLKSITIAGVAFSFLLVTLAVGCCAGVFRLPPALQSILFRDLSALSPNILSCLTSFLTVSAFPVLTGFRHLRTRRLFQDPSGTMLISDYSRRCGSWGLPRVGSYLVLIPGRREFSVGKCTQLRMLPVVSTQWCYQRVLGFATAGSLSRTFQAS